MEDRRAGPVFDCRAGHRLGLAVAEQSLDESTGIGLALILGGAVGNLWDRLLSGRVVDFLLFYVGQYQWPAFNVADSAIVVGAGLLVIEILFAKIARAGKVCLKLNRQKA